MTGAERPLDSIDVGIMWDRLVAISDEIVSTLVRTSFSTIVNESYDLTVAILDSQGQLMAQGTYSVPVFMGTAPATLQHMLRRFPPATLRPGDVVITNDPWLGTGHMFDINVMRPIFRDGRLIAYVISITHLPDIGGLGFGAAAEEIYHEGLRLPVCKLFEAGRRNDFIVELVSNNVRAPEQVIGDLMANVTATQAGETMLCAFLEEYGLADFDGLSAEIRTRSERATRQRIGDMADGCYPNTVQIEGLDGAMTLACTVTVAGDGLAVDFAGTDGCVRRGINVPFCYTRAMVLYSVKCLTVPELPNNGGSVAPVVVSAPEGCLLHAMPPAATGARHMIGHFVSPLVFGALAEAVPERVQADCGMLDLMTFQGRHRDGHAVSTIYFSSGGFGALRGLDGADTTPGPSNMAVVPVEVWETLTSTMVERKALLTDSAGAGAARGGLGQEVVIRNDSGHDMTVFCMANRTDFPALGLHRGGPGRPREHRINDGAVDPKGRYALKPGDRITMVQAGGGGFGDPADRPRDRILSDIESGYISRAAALSDYGVDVAESEG
jgi:N-methylhydantoinase B